MKRFLAILCCLFMTQGASAEPPFVSLRPVARGDLEPAVVGAAVSGILQGLQRGGSADSGAAKRGVLGFLGGKPREGRGYVCGDRSLKGEVVGVVPGKMRGCGVKEAVKLRSVVGVALSVPATVDCTTAKAIKTWVRKGVKPAVGRKGGGVAEMRIMASYSCRTRNSKKGAKISEHGKGRAIDVGGFTLQNGDKISVLKDWGRRKKGRMLKKMHKKACGPFGTVLGPKADRYHKDHFHLDTARYRGGPYCK